MEHSARESTAELLGVSAFTTWALNKPLGWSIFPSAFVAIVFTACVGLAIGRIVYDPIRRFGPSVMLITSVGVGVGLEYETSARRCGEPTRGCGAEARTRRGVIRTERVSERPINSRDFCALFANTHSLRVSPTHSLRF